MSALTTRRSVSQSGEVTQVVLKDGNGNLFALVEHQRGCKWFLYIAARMTARGQPFLTCKAALAAAEQAYQQQAA